MKTNMTTIKNLGFTSLVALGLLFASNDGFSQNKGLNVREDAQGTKVEMPGMVIEVPNFTDTVTVITLGNRKFEVIEKEGDTKIRFAKKPREEFKGHFAGFDLGFNNLATSGFDTSLPTEDAFMDLNTGKSINVGINFLQYSIGLQKERQNFGLVTGVGLNISNYRFANDYLLQRNSVTGNVEGIAVTRPIKKNKLVTSYINIPLMLEYQIPSANNDNKFYVAAGGFVGFKVGSHTKTVYTDSNRKYKSRDDLNLSPVQYGLTGRIGFDFIKLFATYNYSTLFEKDKGPELYPFSVGLTLVNL
ncbi:MAG: porin family protein [Breznakibacter sp.]